MLNVGKKQLIIGLAGAISFGIILGTMIVFLKIKFFPAVEPAKPTPKPEIARTKQLLIEGNQRYTELKLKENDLSQNRRADLSKNGQKPVAAILSCSDSRVPPEIIFDQGLGELFVVRDAGNVIDPITMGSIEYGAGHLKVPLVVVLGHESCGAVKATVDGGELPGSIGTIVEEIVPSYEIVKNKSSKKDIYKNCEDQNISGMVEKIKESPIISELLEKSEIDVIGAKYKIESGKVEFMKPETPGDH